ncbi:hypothetical protein D3C87_1886980 [compost metagenome]
MTAELLQNAGMVERFDTLCDHFDAERCADIDDRFDEALFGRRIQDRQNQLAIDLQAPRGQLQQAEDRGIAGAEIVDLDIDAEFLDPLEIAGRRCFALVEEN